LVHELTLLLPGNVYRQFSERHTLLYWRRFWLDWRPLIFWFGSRRLLLLSLHGKFELFEEFPLQVFGIPHMGLNEVHFAFNHILEVGNLVL
jgi:hypothetical protein